MTQPEVEAPRDGLKPAARVATRLLDSRGFRHDRFTRDPELLGTAGVAGLILPADTFAAADTLFSAASERGVELANHVTPAAALALARQADLVAISFPGFADGRGFTLARRLRNAGYRGVLRASGPLIPDQFAYALACGFDELELPESHVARHGEAAWLADLAASRLSYQRAFARGRNILEARRAARKVLSP